MILPRNFQISIHAFLPTMMPLTCNEPLGVALQVTTPIVKFMIISGRPENYLATGICTGHGGRLDLGAGAPFFQRHLHVHITNMLPHWV